MCHYCHDRVRCIDGTADQKGTGWSRWVSKHGYTAELRLPLQLYTDLEVACQEHSAPLAMVSFVSTSSVPPARDVLHRLASF